MRRARTGSKRHGCPLERRGARLLGIGTWRPATLTTTDIVRIKVVWALLALWRATDYAFDMLAWNGDPDVVEKSLPPQIWASLCAVVGVLILAGIALRAHWAVFYGHALGLIVYLSLSVGALQHAFTMNPPDDWRRGGAVFGIAVVHATLARRSGPRPLSPSAETATETVVAPSE